jgi:hypothetical protein
MAKYAGLVGYVTQEETVPGVWSPVDNPIQMRGDLIRQSASSQNGDKLNEDITLGHRVSLIGDAYAFGNYYNIKWVMLDGMKWEVTSVEIQRPRLILSIGGLYNDQT